MKNLIITLIIMITSVSVQANQMSQEERRALISLLYLSSCAAYDHDFTKISSEFDPKVTEFIDQKPDGAKRYYDRQTGAAITLSETKCVVRLPHYSFKTIISRLPEMLSVKGGKLAMKPFTKTRYEGRLKSDSSNLLVIAVEELGKQPTVAVGMYK
tara:strand:+ start:606 stop:1073 length:468 start_codon:yes stop_codon:yes gene_type:complete